MNITKILDDYGTCIDVEVMRDALSPLRLLGSGGKNRELGIVPKENLDKFLPVLLGYGMGHAYEELCRQYPHIPIAIIDKETPIQKISPITLHSVKHIHINDDMGSTMQKLTQWQEQYKSKPLYPIINPFYQRLDKDFYGKLKQAIETKQATPPLFDFWEKVRQPRFQKRETRLLLISSRYFLFGEVSDACKRLGIECFHLQLANDEMGTNEFITQLLEQIVRLKPDAVLTLNHSGIDREGILTRLLERMEIPLISWFLDNPHLVLYEYAGLNSPWLHIFTWDKDNIPSLKAKGFENVYYLPLGTDTERFHPRNKNVTTPAAWRADISFVGNSMLHKVEKRWEACDFPSKLENDFFAAGRDFVHNPERIMSEFMTENVQADYPKLYAFYTSLQDLEKKLAFEASLTWETTRYYRSSCVEQIMDYNPLIVGDDGWKTHFALEKKTWQWHSPIPYYTHLPNFYPKSTINFNCTSMQMKGATNQRILDVPATGAFVLTDWREQMDLLFEENKEVICYRELGEIPDLVRFYLKNDTAREKIVTAARERVLACHTWDNRVEEIVRVMRLQYKK